LSFPVIAFVVAMAIGMVGYDVLLQRSAPAMIEQAGIPASDG
jgi:hypothetical protein